MLKRIALIILLLITGTIIVYAQDNFLKPDFASIESMIKDKNSTFYYPTLKKKYVNKDTSLSDKEYWMLYYGYFFDDSYSPFGGGIMNDSIRAIKQKGKLGTDDWKNLARHGNEAIKKAPFDLQMLNMTYNAYYKLGDTANMKLFRHRLGKIARAILSTGDGQTEKTAFYVVSVEDEYMIISILGYKFGGSQSKTASDCDYLTLESNEDNIKGLYFDVKQLFKGYEKMFKTK